MIIADSKDDRCMRRLSFVLEQTYPAIRFFLEIGHTSRIEVSDEEIKKFEDINPGIFKLMVSFCEGFTIGWEDANG